MEVLDHHVMKSLLGLLHRKGLITEDLLGQTGRYLDEQWELTKARQSGEGDGDNGPVPG